MSFCAQAPKAAKPTQAAKPAKSGGGKQKKKKWSKGKQKEKVSVGPLNSCCSSLLLHGWQSHGHLKYHR